MGYDTVTGEPVELRMVALTGDPGLTGMESVVALSADDLFNALQPSEFPMNEKLRQLLAKLGITVPENAQLTDEQATAALSAVVELQTKAGSADSLQTQVTALSAEVETAKTGAVDLTKYVPRDTYDALRTDFVALSANHSTATLAQVLTMPRKTVASSNLSAATSSRSAARLALRRFPHSCRANSRSPR